MGASPYSSLPYSRPAPWGDQVHIQREFDCGRCFNRYSRLDTVSISPRAPLCTTDRPIGFDAADSTFRALYTLARFWLDDRLVRAICENSGRVFVKATYMHVYTRPTISLFNNVAHTRAQRCSLAFEIQNLKIESINPIRFFSPCVFSDYFFFSHGRARLGEETAGTTTGE